VTVEGINATGRQLTPVLLTVVGRLAVRLHGEFVMS
jgi:hypothetical protein